MRIAYEHIISNNALLTKNRCGDMYTTQTRHRDDTPLGL